MNAKRWISRIIRAPRTLTRRVTDQYLVRRYLIWHDVTVGADLRASGLPRLRIVEGGRLIVGNGVTLVSRPTGNPLHLHRPCTFSVIKPGAVIEIGDSSALSGTVICAASRVSIGQRVMIGANCTLSDTDFHPLSPEQRRIHPTENAASRPIVIEDDVFIGTQAILLKGAILGHGCVVGAGAVVTGEFPPRSIIAGNPARLIKTLD
jgi:acetyltransferase-like isoleucine patch superfamily enzyme